MREIKFRIWDTVNNIIIPWGVLKMISTNAIGEIRTETMQAFTDDSYVTLTDLKGNTCEIVSDNPTLETTEKSRMYIRYNKGHNIWIDDNLIKLQFTGLLDKNGKEIYEDDIIEGNHPFKGRYHKGVVVFIDYRFTLRNFFWGHFDTPNEPFSEGTEYWEVIGSIHENPELLQ